MSCTTPGENASNVNQHRRVGGKFIQDPRWSTKPSWVPKSAFFKFGRVALSNSVHGGRQFISALLTVNIEVSIRVTFSPRDRYIHGRLMPGKLVACSSMHDCNSSNLGYIRAEFVIWSTSCDSLHLQLLRIVIEMYGRKFGSHAAEHADGTYLYWVSLWWNVLPRVSLHQ